MAALFGRVAAGLMETGGGLGGGLGQAAAGGAASGLIGGLFNEMTDGEGDGLGFGVFDGDGNPFKRRRPDETEAGGFGPTPEGPFMGFGSMGATDPNMIPNAGNAFAGGWGQSPPSGGCGCGCCSCGQSKPPRRVYTCEEKCAWKSRMKEQCKGCSTYFRSGRRKTCKRKTPAKRKAPKKRGTCGKPKYATFRRYTELTPDEQMNQGWLGANAGYINGGGRIPDDYYTTFNTGTWGDRGRPGTVRSRRQARQNNRQNRRAARRG